MNTTVSDIATPGDSVSIRNLHLPHGITAPDVWGKTKEQPGLVSLKLTLRDGFSGTASEDGLDASIHYGQLAKRIRAENHPGQTVYDVLDAARGVVHTMASMGPGTKFLLARADLEVLLPKASMAGEAVTLTHALHFDAGGHSESLERVFTVRNVKLMVLIGVNAYERTAKQPVVAYIAITWDVKTAWRITEDSTRRLFGTEQILVKVIEDTSFETLETLADYAVKQLQDRLLSELLPGCRVQLRLEKPRAIAFADAPVVEVIRQMHAGSEKPKKAAVMPELHVTKPYVS